MGFFDFLKKKATPVKQWPIAKQAEINSFGERLDRLTAEGDLPFGWFAKHEHIFKGYEMRITQIAVELQP